MMAGQAKTQSQAARPIYVLMLLAGDKGEPVLGRTRFEKLVFLVQKQVIEERKSSLSDDLYHFRPLHFGPFSEEVFDDFSALQVLNLASVSGDGSEDQVFSITDRGKRALERLLDANPVAGRVFSEVEKLKKTYGKLDLNALVGSVYRTYPEFTSRSIIRDRYLY